MDIKPLCPTVWYGTEPHNEEAEGHDRAFIAEGYAWIECNGVTKRLSQWAEELGISEAYLRSRLSKTTIRCALREANGGLDEETTRRCTQL